MPKTAWQERQDNLNLGAAGGGETNTATNVGTDGLGVFYQKTGVNLEFKNVAPASSKITVVANGQDIDLDVNEAALGADTLQEVTDAGNNTTTTIQADGSVFLTSAAIESTLTGATMEFWSATSNTSGRTAFSFRMSNGSVDADYVMDWENIAFGKIARMDKNGEITIGTDADDLFIHEKSTGVIPTGTWAPTGAWDFDGVSAETKFTAIDLLSAVGTSLPFAGATRGIVYLDAGDNTLKYNSSSTKEIPVSGVHAGATEPNTVRALWVDTSGGASAYSLKVYDGTAWVEFWSQV
jgi:hypothetical protein